MHLEPPSVKLGAHHGHYNKPRRFSGKGSAEPSPALPRACLDAGAFDARMGLDATVLEHAGTLQAPGFGFL